MAEPLVLLLLGAVGAGSRIALGEWGGCRRTLGAGLGPSLDRGALGIAVYAGGKFVLGLGLVVPLAALRPLRPLLGFVSPRAK
jgi:hypothetical protein